MGCTTTEAGQLLGTAMVVRKLRVALLAGDWRKVDQVLTEAQGKVLADIVAEEMGSAQDELDNRAIIHTLTAAMSSGAPHLANGHLLLEHLEVRLGAFLCASVLVPASLC